MSNEAFAMVGAKGAGLTAAELAAMVSNNPELRCCVLCSARGGPWRHPGAQRCINCDEPNVARRKQWAKEYHAARAKAVSRLVKRHHLEFEEILFEERSKRPEPGEPIADGAADETADSTVSPTFLAPG